MVPVIRNYLLLLFFISVQTDYVVRISEQPYMGGNLDLHNALVVFLIYLMPLLRYNEVVKYFAPITLWTIGFMLVFNTKIPVSGALLIGFAGCLDQYIKSKECKDLNVEKNDIEH